MGWIISRTAKATATLPPRVSRTHRPQEAIGSSSEDGPIWFAAFGRTSNAKSANRHCRARQQWHPRTHWRLRWGVTLMNES